MSLGALRARVGRQVVRRAVGVDTVPFSDLFDLFGAVRKCYMTPVETERFMVGGMLVMTCDMPNRSRGEFPEDGENATAYGAIGW